MTVTGLCRGGPVHRRRTPAGQATAIDDNRRAIDEAGGAHARQLPGDAVAGGVPEGSRDLEAAHGPRSCRRARTEILPSHARAAGVPLAIEPMHPMTCADRGCVHQHARPGQRPLRPLGDGIGIAVDTYHVWWDPALEIRDRPRQAGRILAFHVNDWLRHTRDLVFDRGMMGDGVIDIPRIRGWVEAAGYSGMNEAEIFSILDWWKRDPDEVVATCIERHEWAV